MPHVWEFILILNVNAIFVEGKLFTYENSLSGSFKMLEALLLIDYSRIFIMLAMH